MSRFTTFAYRPKFDRNDLKRRQQLGKLLREARDSAGFTQAEVALVLGYKQQYDISLIENANRMLDPIELENFARLYGKSLNAFATLRNDRPTTEELQDELKKRSKQLAKRRLFSKRKPTMTAEQIAD